MIWQYSRELSFTEGLSMPDLTIHVIVLQTMGFSSDWNVNSLEVIYTLFFLFIPPNWFKVTRIPLNIDNSL